MIIILLYNFTHHRMQPAKSKMHSANTLSSVTLGKGYTANLVSSKGSLPSAKKHSSKKTLSKIKIKKQKKIGKVKNALGKHFGYTGNLVSVKDSCRVFFVGHWQKLWQVLKTLGKIKIEKTQK